MLFNILSVFKKPLHGCSMVLILFLIGGCQSKRNTSDQAKHDSPQGKSMVKYAIGFDLLNFESYKVLHLFQHSSDATDTLSYVLYDQGAKVDDQFSSLEKILVPQQDIAMLHSSYISFFDLCQSIDHIKAISEAKYIYNDNVYNAVKNHELYEVGYGETLDKEKLLELGVSSVVTVGFPNAPNKSQEMLSELGIPVLVFSDWQESTLLGRAEWIKVVAALTGSDALANSEFQQMESEYNRLKALIPKDIPKPKIVCNLPYKGSWYVPGGNSYVSNVCGQMMAAKEGFSWILRLCTPKVLRQISGRIQVFPMKSKI